MIQFLSFVLHPLVLSRCNDAEPELGHGELEAERSQRGTLTCSIYGRTGSLQGTQALPSKGDVLLAERETLCLQQLSAVLLPQDGMDRLQKVFPALRGAAGHVKKTKKKEGGLLCQCAKEKRGWAGRDVPSAGGQCPYLQHSWNVLSGRPSDSDFVWTISHTAEVSQSEGRKQL